MSDTEQLFVQTRPLRSMDQLAELVSVAAEDAHTVIAPSHLVTRGQEIVGYASVGAIPMLHVWLKRGAVRPRESLMLLNLGEGLLAGKGHGNVIVPCWDGSPFAPYMERLGFSKLGATTLYTKGL